METNARNSLARLGPLARTGVWRGRDNDDDHRLAAVPLPGIEGDGLRHGFTSRVWHAHHAVLGGQPAAATECERLDVIGVLRAVGAGEPAVLGYMSAGAGDLDNGELRSSCDLRLHRLRAGDLMTNEVVI